MLSIMKSSWNQPLQFQGIELRHQVFKQDFMILTGFAFTSFDLFLILDIFMTCFTEKPGPKEHVDEEIKKISDLQTVSLHRPTVQ